MIPILSWIIVGRPHHLQRPRLRPVEPVRAGHGLTYAAAVSRWGCPVPCCRRRPCRTPGCWVPSPLVFVVLALSMFGFYGCSCPRPCKAACPTTPATRQGGSLAASSPWAPSRPSSSALRGRALAAPCLYIARPATPSLGGAALFTMAWAWGTADPRRRAGPRRLPSPARGWKASSGPSA